MPQPAKAPAGEALPDWDAAADEAIAASYGDVRAAVKALLVLVDTLERDLAFARAAMPSGFARGWFQGRCRGDASRRLAAGPLKVVRRVGNQYLQNMAGKLVCRCGNRQATRCWWVRSGGIEATRWRE